MWTAIRVRSFRHSSKDRNESVELCLATAERTHGGDCVASVASARSSAQNAGKSPLRASSACRSSSRTSRDLLDGGGRAFAQASTHRLKARLRQGD